MAPKTRSMTKLALIPPGPAKVVERKKRAIAKQVAKVVAKQVEKVVKKDVKVKKVPQVAVKTVGKYQNAVMSCKKSGYYGAWVKRGAGNKWESRGCFKYSKNTPRRFKKDRRKGLGGARVLYNTINGSVYYRRNGRKVYVNNHKKGFYGLVVDST